MGHVRKRLRINPDYLNLRDDNPNLDTEIDRRLSKIQKYISDFQKMHLRIIRAAQSRDCYCDVLSKMSDEQIEKLAKRVAGEKCQ